MVNNAEFYFKNYSEWHHAITERCKIKLTSDYTRERISALRDPNNPQTKEFAAMYGDAYLNQVIQWFEQAELEQ